MRRLGRWIGLYALFGLVASQLIGFWMDQSGGFESNRAHLVFAIAWAALSLSSIGALLIWLGWRAWLLVSWFRRARGAKRQVR
ncbi:hypothetical protein O203_21335 [Ectopseudomonas chengduensis]|nr:hypothetical protein O203_21335 [Pseudomonas chengduensis]